jgi:proline racemase
MQTAAGGGAFLAAAQQGMFAVDMASAKKMVTAIEQIRTSLNDQLEIARLLKNQVKLGDFGEASAIAGLDRLVASGDEQSLDFRRIGHG